MYTEQFIIPAVQVQATLTVERPGGRVGGATSLACELSFGQTFTYSFVLQGVTPLTLVL